MESLPNSVSSPSHNSFYSFHCFKPESAHALFHGKGHLQGQAYERTLPKVSSLKDPSVLLAQCLPRSSGCVMPVACMFSPMCGRKASQGRALLRTSLNGHVLHSGSHAKVRSTPIRALDSNPHDTADRSDAVSDENKNSQGTDSSESFGGAQSMPRGARIDDSASSVDGLNSTSGMEMHGFVLGLSQQADAWDSASIGAPVVRRYVSDNEERWLMWYSGKCQQTHSGANEVIGLAISSNGVHWKRENGRSDVNEPGVDIVGKVLDCSDNWWAFDTEVIRPSDVLVMSSLKARAAAGVYWMYYTGACSEEVEVPKPGNLPMNLPDFKYANDKITVRRTRPGLTMSHDGRNWARIEGDHHSGSLFDVGVESEWDSLFIADPHIVFFNADDLRLYYHSFDQRTGCFSVGFARSRDAMKWIKFGMVLGGGPVGSFDELGVKSPHVVSNPSGKGFLMVYEGVSADGSTSFGLAQSDDGLSHWERCSDGPVFTTAAESNAWDAREIHSPCLVHMDGNEWRLYYQGVDYGGRSGIGTAVCTDGSLRKFQRCHGLHL